MAAALIVKLNISRAKQLLCVSCTHTAERSTAQPHHCHAPMPSKPASLVIPLECGSPETSEFLIDGFSALATAQDENEMATEKMRFQIFGGKCASVALRLATANSSGPILLVRIMKTRGEGEIVTICESVPTMNLTNSNAASVLQDCLFRIATTNEIVMPQLFYKKSTDYYEHPKAERSLIHATVQADGTMLANGK